MNGRPILGVMPRAVDRLLHGTELPSPNGLDPDAAALHASVPVVDLLVGTALFRSSFLVRRRHGHVDLPRLREGGVDLVGFTIATRHPDLRGTLSNWHFWAQGVPQSMLGSNMAIASWVLERIESWIGRSGGRLMLARSAGDLAAVSAPRDRLGIGPKWAFVGIQGGHLLDGDVANVEALFGRGVRMFAPAHVMDNALVGSNTGRKGDGLSGFGREVVAELERLGIVVDLAHMSTAGIQDTLPLLRRPFLLSHTGFTRLSNRRSRIPGRRFTPGNRNLPDREALMVAEAGGVIGVTLSSLLLGGRDLDAVERSVDAALELAGPEGVALGSDMDGGLRMVCDAAGLPYVTARLLATGQDRATVAGFLGGNALRVLSSVWT